MCTNALLSLHACLWKCSYAILYISYVTILTSSYSLDRELLCLYSMSNNVIWWYIGVIDFNTRFVALHGPNQAVKKILQK